MEPDEPSGGGVTGSLRRSVDLVVRTLQNRAELLGIELEEEGRWVVSALVWTAAAIFFAVLSISIVTVTLILIIPESLRVWALLGFSALYLFGAVYAVTGLKKQFKNKRPALSDTVNELKKDLDWIQSRD
jgi:uncharacterized membrane protein YqjE